MRCLESLAPYEEASLGEAKEDEAEDGLRVVSWGEASWDWFGGSQCRRVCRPVLAFTG